MCCSFLCPSQMFHDDTLPRNRSRPPGAERPPNVLPMPSPGCRNGMRQVSTTVVVSDWPPLLTVPPLMADLNHQQPSLMAFASASARARARMRKTLENHKMRFTRVIHEHHAMLATFSAAAPLACVGSGDSYTCSVAGVHVSFVALACNV